MIFRSLFSVSYLTSGGKSSRKILSQKNKLRPVFNAARLSLHRGAGTAELPPFQKSSFNFSLGSQPVRGKMVALSLKSIHTRTLGYGAWLYIERHNASSRKSRLSLN